jgi:hypothetical protein
MSSELLMVEDAGANTARHWASTTTAAPELRGMTGQESRGGARESGSAVDAAPPNPTFSAVGAV